MSKVKFIQIGSETLQYNDITPEVGDKIEGYKSKLDRTLNDYPGAIIFGTYTEGGEKKQEIWANGTSYSVGGGGGGTVYVGTYQVTSEGKLPETTTGYDAANNLYFFKDEWSTTTDTSGKTIIDTTKCVAIGDKFKEGDIYVEKRNTEAKALESSGYVYSKGRWEALAGSVNAENVWFPDGVMRSETWGCKFADSKHTAQTECEGKNLKDLIEFYILQVQQASPEPRSGTITTPTLSVSDGDCSVTVSSNDTEVTEVLFGSTLDISTSYDPSLTKSNKSPEACTVTAAYITGLGNGYKQLDKNGNPTGSLIKNLSNGTLYGSSYKYRAVYNSNQNDGNEQSTTLKVSGGGSTMSQNGQIKSGTGATTEITDSYTLITSELGDVSVSLTGSNNNSWGGHYEECRDEKTWTTVTQYTLPGIDGIACANNKGEMDDPLITSEVATITGDFETISASDRSSTSSKTVNVYAPIYIYYVSTNDASGKYTGKSCSYDYSSTVALSPNDSVNISIPATGYITKISGTTATDVSFDWTSYFTRSTTSTEKILSNGAKLKYVTYSVDPDTFGQAEATPAGANIKISMR